MAAHAPVVSWCVSRRLTGLGSLCWLGCVLKAEGEQHKMEQKCTALSEASSCTEFVAIPAVKANPVVSPEDGETALPKGMDRGRQE